jgi:hypothetical protein
MMMYLLTLRPLSPFSPLTVISPRIQKKSFLIKTVNKNLYSKMLEHCNSAVLLGLLCNLDLRCNDPPTVLLTIVPPLC